MLQQGKSRELDVIKALFYCIKHSGNQSGIFATVPFAKY